MRAHLGDTVLYMWYSFPELVSAWGISLVCVGYSAACYSCTSIVAYLYPCKSPVRGRLCLEEYSWRFIKYGPGVPPYGLVMVTGTVNPRVLHRTKTISRKQLSSLYLYVVIFRHRWVTSYRFSIKITNHNCPFTQWSPHVLMLQTRFDCHPLYPCRKIRCFWRTVTSW